jgi:pimeloyl-ACP methyl ester carboxylesterase
MRMATHYVWLFHLCRLPEESYFSLSMSNPVYCLHGAIGAADQLVPIADMLRIERSDVRVHDFIGHGKREMPAEEFSIRLLAEDLLQRMNNDNVQVADIFGYSMGGYVGLYLAKHHAHRIGRIVTVATKLDWNLPTAEKEVKMLDPQTISTKVPAFAKALRERHAACWENVLQHTSAMMLRLGAKPEMSDEDFSSIEHEVLMCVGDRDKMVSVEETLRVYHLLKNGRFCVLPSTAHPIEQLNLQTVSNLILKFI